MTETEKQSEAIQDAGDRGAEVFQAAYELFCTKPDWVTFFRQILGREGIVRQNYPGPESLLEFEQTQTYAEIQQMLAKLRERGIDPEVTPPEAVKVITVRIPESLHHFLRDEADVLRTSVNKLCISKLLQFVDKELVPEEAIIRANLAKARRERMKLKEMQAHEDVVLGTPEAEFPKEEGAGEDL